MNHTLNVSEGEYEVRGRFWKTGDSGDIPQFTTPTQGRRSSGDTVQHVIIWERMDCKVPGSYRYPATSVMALKLEPTDRLSGGIPNIQVLASRNYIKAHNGSSWVNKPASNPAWICYDILANGHVDHPEHTAYGAGVDYGKIIYADFEAWADNCEDEGYECHFIADMSQRVSEMLNRVSATGRGAVIQQGAKFSCIIDKPELPSQVFNVANIVANSFTETWLPLEERATHIEVEYWDAARDYKRSVAEVVSSDFTELTDTEHRTKVQLFGCTSETQARNHANYLLECNRLQKRTISFEAAVDSIACQPADVIRVQHDVPQWGAGGRVQAIIEPEYEELETEAGTVLETESGDPLTVGEPRQVIVDQALTYSSGCRIIVRNPETDEAQVNPVSAINGTTVTVEDDWAFVPQRDDLYSFGTVAETAELWRITDISRTSEQRRKITAIEYQEACYD